MGVSRIALRWFVLLMIIFLSACGGPNKADLRKREVAMRDLGYEYFRAGQHTKALQKLLEAEKLYPKDHILQNYLGQVYLAKREPELAITHFKKAIDIKPEYAVAKNNLGVAYLSEKRWDDAIAVFKELDGSLLYATPHYPLTNLGYAYYRKEEYQNAEKYYLKALDLDPTHPPALKGLGRTYVELGKGSKAVAALTKAARHYPQDAATYYELGRAYMMIGAYPNAKQAFRRVIELDPDSSLADDARLALKHIR